MIRVAICVHKYFWSVLLHKNEMTYTETHGKIIKVCIIITTVLSLINIEFGTSFSAVSFSWHLRGPKRHTFFVPPNING